MKKAFLLTISTLLFVGSLTPNLYAGINDGLVAYYPFNGNADDESGNGNHGTVSGAVLVPDLYGNANSAYSFDGADDYIRVPDSDSLDLTSTFTLAVWIKPNSYDGSSHGGYYPDALSKAPSNYEPYRLSFTHNQTSIQISSSSSNRTWPTVSTGIPINQWTHLAVTFDSGDVNFYHNGTPVGSKTATITLLRTTTGPLYIGARKYANNTVDGILDEIRIYDRVLSAAEIETLAIVDCSEYGGDTDFDNICDDIDNCPNISNPNQEDADGDDIGDLCDTLCDDPTADNYNNYSECGCKYSDLFPGQQNSLCPSEISIMVFQEWMDVDYCLLMENGNKAWTKAQYDELLVGLENIYNLSSFDYYEGDVCDRTPAEYWAEKYQEPYENGDCRIDGVNKFTFPTAPWDGTFVSNIAPGDLYWHFIGFMVRTEEATNPFSCCKQMFQSEDWTAFTSPECQTDSDCDDGLYCNGVESCSTEGSMCVTTGDVDCGDLYCDESSDQCVAVECFSDADCPSGTECDQGQCVAVECFSDADCPSGTECSQGQCVECLLDDDCDDGAYCNGAETCNLNTGECVVGSSPCLASETCDEADDQCVAVECFSDADCPSGTECDQGQCVECLLDEDCDDGLYCNGEEICDVGSCATGLSPCLAGELCDETGDMCVECLIDDDCSASEECINNVCVERPCELTIEYREILASRLRRPVKRTLKISGGVGFNPQGAVDAGPLEVLKITPVDRKNIVKVTVLVPAGLEPGIIPISVGDCIGEIEIME